MGIASIFKDLQDIEQSLTTLCQNTIKETVRKQKETIEEEFQSKKANLLANRNSPLIKLNVGGKKFTTSLATLTSDPESKLAQMFFGDIPFTKDEKGVYLIDRNGDYFSYVLDYLRDNTTELPRELFISKKIKEEMDFFGIVQKAAPKGPMIAWAWDVNKQYGVSMTENNTRVTKVQGTSYGVAYGDTVFSEGIWKWKITVTNVAQSYWISAGLFSETELPTPASFSYTTCWGFSSYGNLYRMTGTGNGVMLVTGDVFEMEYNADTGDFHLAVPNKNVKIFANIHKGFQSIKPFAYVWTNGDCLTLSFD